MLCKPPGAQQDFVQLSSLLARERSGSPSSINETQNLVSRKTQNPASVCRLKISSGSDCKVSQNPETITQHHTASTTFSPQSQSQASHKSTTNQIVVAMAKAMAMAGGHIEVATVGGATGQLRVKEGLVSQFMASTAFSPSLGLGSRFASQLCVSFSGGARMVMNSSTQRFVVPRAAAAAASPTMAQSMTRIADTFAVLKEQGKVALIPYLTAGDPDLDTTAEAMRLLDACGADIIELGVPYSDPLADGPVIQAAATRSLSRGTTLDKVLSMLREVSPSLKAPVVLFIYYNPILKRGLEPFLKAVKEAGGSGLVVPDVPLEETDKLRKQTTANGLELILLTTPTTPKSRMDIIAKASQGFVYLVSLTGVTGARTSVQSRVQGLLKELKEVTDKPIAVGFGISRPEHAAQVVEWGADGVIVGSAMVKILGEAASPKEGLAALEKFTNDLKNSIP